MRGCLQFAFVCLGSVGAETYPSASITNGIVEAKLFLPDAERGSYRGTRFDWSGIISSLRWNGHEFFGQWYAKHDPLVNDAITGPVDIFDNDATGLGYAEATAGEGFVRLGVGVVEKPREAAYRGTRTYRLLDPGVRHVQTNRNSLRFEHRLTGPRGFGYVYAKTVSLTPGKPEMVIVSELRNSGSRPLEITVFNHGFFQLDGEPAGPRLKWTFPWKVQPTGELGELGEIRDAQIAYTRELRDGERLLVVLRGYGVSAADHHYSVENTKTGVGVRVIADQPITHLTFWSRRLAYSPEATVQLNIPAGATKTWRTRYEFYSTEGQH